MVPVSTPAARGVCGCDMTLVCYGWTTKMLPIFSALGCPLSLNCALCICIRSQPDLRYRRRGFDPQVGKIPLEEEMVTQSSILAWRILWTEEPGRLQSVGSQKSQT